jgi:sec-independent protein translocase protein TatB
VLNVGLGEIVVVCVVVLIVFGPERLPEMARQLGRGIGRVRLTTQRMLDERKGEAELRDLNLPDLRVGSLRAQARNYVADLMDIEGQMAELEREEDAKQRAEITRTDTATPDTAASVAASPPPFDPDAT